MTDFQQMRTEELAIYRAAYEAEQAGFNDCSRHAHCLRKLVEWNKKQSHWFVQEKCRYLAGRIIAGDYLK